MAPTNQPAGNWAAVLLGLVGLAETVTLAFVKNPEHHQTAADAVNKINAIAAPVAALVIAQQAAQQPKE